MFTFDVYRRVQTLRLLSRSVHSDRCWGWIYLRRKSGRSKRGMCRHKRRGISRSGRVNSSFEERHEEGAGKQPRKRLRILVESTTRFEKKSNVVNEIGEREVCREREEENKCEIDVVVVFRLENGIFFFWGGEVCSREYLLIDFENRTKVQIECFFAFLSLSLFPL